MNFNYILFRIVVPPADTGRKLNVHKTFRRSPVRFLNVLYTFNLRPVSTGTRSVYYFTGYGNIPTRLIKLVAEFLVSSLAFVIIPLRDNPTKLSNTLKQFVSCCQRIV